MEISDKQKFNKIKDKAELLYKSIVRLYCPALKSEINFSSDGFHHLRFDGTRAERPKNVQMNKLLCLKDVVNILKVTTTVQEYRESLKPVGKPNKNGFRVTKLVSYYGFVAIIDTNSRKRIRVVVRKIGDGNYHFWSVMPLWQQTQINSTQTVRRVGGLSMEDG